MIYLAVQGGVYISTCIGQRKGITTYTISTTVCTEKREDLDQKDNVKTIDETLEGSYAIINSPEGSARNITPEN